MSFHSHLVNIANYINNKVSGLIESLQFHHFVLKITLQRN
ncbi:hypothetical protein M486_841 [Yersinia pestis 1045]|uniref:Uncharacterized protein n=2 Tax=Yersinia pseudotuberculosis complex TaxID=1649845 RepID=A0AAX2I4D8_YERPE|nr:hypothetical protein DJ40_2015 [Yersinia pseudotuberculosis]AJI92097.1 hypothetical protein CH59_1527 [Yersinia pestis]AJI98017.1 hypothetical protein BZ18_290 [Yersinia pestis Pestoides F]AJJ53454.1 hypothetical protein BZ17_2177 [Yersinia pseudotuberculosis IP 32953]AJJ82372.1 hypothetical protein CH56_1656 [Yersinia pestis Angola]AJJ87722.1 hypothetical protein AK38_2230 [Yersinia pestis CO92]AJK14068.1 hypothetical protein CH60_252 [Yersinia pestis str. Pestoides B]AKS58579.1 hypothet